MTRGRIIPGEIVDAEAAERAIRAQAAADADALLAEWRAEVVQVGHATFRDAAEQLYSGNSTVLVCEAAISHCRNSLISYQQKQTLQEVIV